MTNDIHIIIPCARPWLVGSLVSSVHYSEPHSLSVYFHIILAGEEVWSPVRLNHTIDMIDSGWVYILPDDTHIHPSFLSRIGELMTEHPNKECFVVDQRRKDGIGDNGVLKASQGNMVPCQVDSGQIIVKRDFIGDLRYQELAVGDGVFARDLFSKDPSKIMYVNETLSYFESQWWLRNDAIHHHRYKNSP